MYLSAQNLALANQAVLETFENCSVAWQAIPHWDTGDPAQTQVPADDVKAAVPGVVPIETTWSKDFTVTLATAVSPSPTALLGAVAAKTAELAAIVDKAVVVALKGKATAANLDSTDENSLMACLVAARALVEKNGFRAPSCLLTNTSGLILLSQFVGGASILTSLLEAATINSRHRVEQVEDPIANNDPARAILLGRRQRIAQDAAGDASPGEEPVDLAVSVRPSLEVTGEKGANQIGLVVRMKGALRIKDSSSLVFLH